MLTLSVCTALVLMAGPAFLVKDGALTFIGWRLADWWIEGSEIAFAFARNLAHGAGFVATPGGERVEGFTSPAWLALLTLWQLAGVDGFASSKIMAVLFTAVTIVLSWALAREVLDEDERGAALLAPVLLALNPQFVIWNTSGLELPLFHLLLTAALWRGAVEARRGGRSWSVGLWTLIALTRPEGVLYGWIGAIAACLVAARAGRLRRVASAWGVGFVLPLAALEFARWWFFAWPLATPVYVAMQGALPSPFAWHARGWSQISRWLWDSRVVWVTPVILVGVVRGRALAAAWGCAALTIALSLALNGSWMRGHPDLSPLSVPLVIALTLGLRTIAGAVQARLGGRTAAGTLTATVLVLFVAIGWINHTAWFIGKREVQPASVQKRAAYITTLLDRLGVRDTVIRRMEPDPGGSLWFTTDTIVDYFGLTSVTLAHHPLDDRAFAADYVMNEARPQTAHMHGGWASTTRVPESDGWVHDYIAVPPYPMSETVPHVGTYIRRDLLMSPAYDGPSGREVRFGNGLTLAGFDIPSPQVSVGKAFHVEVSVRADATALDDGTRLLMFIAGPEGRVQSWDLPLGFDWLPPSEWRAGEVWRGGFDLTLDKSLPAADFDVGFVMLGAGGAPVALATVEGDPTTRAPLPPHAVVGGDAGVAPRFARGEVRFPAVLQVGPGTTAERAARSDYTHAIDAARAGLCEDAAASWRLARWHVPNADRWIDERREDFARAEAACYAHAALEEADRTMAAAMLQQGRVWRWRSAPLIEAQRTVGAALYEQGLAAREARDWERAWRRFEAAVQADPSLAWARRYAEEARDLKGAASAE